MNAAQHNTPATAVHQQHRAEADRWASRLITWRAQEATFIQNFHNALEAFKTTSPAQFTALSAHMKNCSLAASSPARQTGMMLWFRIIPFSVSSSLTALCKFYHGEAKAMTELVRSERWGGTWADVNSLDPEVVNASAGTVLKVRGNEMEVGSFLPFGASEREPAPLQHHTVAANPFLEESMWKEDTIRAVAVVKVCLVYLDSEAALSGVTDGRWELARESFVLHCSNTALQMKGIADWVNKPGVSLAEKHFFANALSVVRNDGIAARKSGRFGKIAKGRELVKELEATHHQLAIARADESEEVEALEEDRADIVRDLLEIEEGGHGVGALFGNWRDLQMA